MSVTATLDIEEAFLKAKTHELFTLVYAECETASKKGSGVISDIEEDGNTVLYLKVKGSFKTPVINEVVKELMAAGWAEVYCIRRYEGVYFTLVEKKVSSVRGATKSPEERVRMIEFVFNLYPLDYAREPEILYEHSQSFLFGLVKLSIVIEDGHTEDLTKRYKHMLTFKVLGNEYSVMLRSPTLGAYRFNGFDPHDCIILPL